MIASSRSYAIGMVHFQIAGGWRMLVSMAIVYLCVIGCGAGLWHYYEMGGARGIPLAAVVTLLLALEGIVLVIFGAMRVSTSIRTDVSSRMIESHRLMPISSWRAMLGYIFGSTSHASAFLLLNGIMTVIIGMQAGGTFSKIVLNHGILLAFAVFVWSGVAIGTFIYRNILMLGLGIAVFSTCTGLIQGAYILFPGFALLLTPFIGDTAFSFSTSTAVHWTYPIALVGQAGLFAVFFAGACRLYRGAHATAFSMLLAVLLLALWAGLSGVGINQADELPAQRILGLGRRRGPFGPREVNEVMAIAQIIAAILSCALLSLVALWTMTKQSILKPIAWPVQAGVVAILAGVCVVPGFGAANVVDVSRSMLISVFVLGAHVWTALMLVRILRNARPLYIFLGTGMALAMLWLGPLLLETLRQVMFHPDEPDTLPLLLTFSPVGALVNAWITEKNTSPVAGLVWQWTVPALMTAVMVLLQKRANSKPPVAPIAAPAAPPVRLTPPPAP